MGAPSSLVRILPAIAAFAVAGVVATIIFHATSGPSASNNAPTAPTPDSPSTAPSTPSPSTPSLTKKTYTIRGRIEQLPDPTVKGSMLQIHHERIEDWVNSKGDAKGMNSMIMPFPPMQGVSLDGLAIGDLVEFKAEFDYSRLPPQRTVSITKLAPDTVLNIQGN